MVMFYTSGTTGKPKGVKRKIPQVDADTNATNFTMLLMLFGIMPEQNNVHFCGSPLYHTAAMNWVTSSLHMGHCVVLHEKWDAEHMLQAIEQYKVTTTHIVPTQMVRLTKQDEASKQRYNLSSLTHVIHTAAPCPREVKREIIDWFGPVVYEYYASTEGGGTLVNSEDWMKFPGTVGRPWPGADIKVLDDDGNELPAGQSGTIYMLMSELSRFEYKGDKEKTARTQIGDYFTAGDIGFLNNEGYLFLSDRKIDMIISGGANIYPAEIESALITHPDVLDCCVFGVPNEEWGEEVKAAVQLRKGIEAGSDVISDMLEFLKPRIAKMKLPKSFDFHEELPRDPNGKIYKRNLRDPYWKGIERNV
jgi:long-chain acyl-CoA synthetase